MPKTAWLILYINNNLYCFGLVVKRSGQQQFQQIQTMLEQQIFKIFEAKRHVVMIYGRTKWKHHNRFHN